MNSTKIISTIFMFFIVGTSFVYAQDKNSETITHKVTRGSLHKGGSIRISVNSSKDLNAADQMQIKINYKLKKRALLPVSSKKLRGTYSINIPSDFSDERGYLNLAVTKKINLEKATIIYAGRENIRGYLDCHVIKILPHNKKSKITAYYHPSVASVGWIKLELTLLKVPIISPYKIESYIK